MTPFDLNGSIYSDYDFQEKFSENLFSSKENSLSAFGLCLRKSLVCRKRYEIGEQFKPPHKILYHAVRGFYDVSNFKIVSACQIQHAEFREKYHKTINKTLGGLELYTVM